MKKIALEDIGSIENALVIDSRPASEFVDGFLHGSLYLALDEHLPSLLRHFVTEEQTIVLLCAEAHAMAFAAKLDQEGYHNIVGYLPERFDQWRMQRGMVDMVVSVDAYELAIDLPNDPDLIAVDVRSPLEYAQQHLQGSQNLPLTDMVDVVHIASLPEMANIYVFCNNGNRSATACSILRQQGISNIRWVQGGLQQMTQQQGLPMERSKENLN